MWKWIDGKIDAAIRGAVQGGLLVFVLWLLEARIEIYIGN